MTDHYSKLIEWFEGHERTNGRSRYLTNSLERLRKACDLLRDPIYDMEKKRIMILEEERVKANYEGDLVNFLAKEYLEHKEKLDQAGISPAEYFELRRFHKKEELMFTQGTSMIYFNPEMNRSQCMAVLEDLHKKGIIRKPDLHYHNTIVYPPTYHIP